jgi:Xaa-Pro aminopeptidase
MDHSGRLRRIRTLLQDHKLDLLLVTHLPNVRYLSGFTGSAAALLVGDRGATFFTDGRYLAQAHAEVSGAEIVIARKAPTTAVADFLRELAAGRSGKRVLGIEADYVPVATRERLATQTHGRFKLASTSSLVEQVRMVKDATEIRLIRRAVDVGARLLRIARNKIRPGATEVQVAAALEYEARRCGAEGMSFPTIIAGGKRSALPHGRASEARIPRNGFVVCDFGVILAGYCSDRTRTVHVGRPSTLAREMYEAVREAQEAAIATVRPGVKAAEVDRAARRVLREAKLERYFTHSAGHGLGLEIHELPRLATGQDQILEKGMVITVEPGAYIPGKCGVRIEDVVVVTARGCEVLAPAEKELIVL